MILMKILKRDVLRKKVITLVVFAFILVSSLLVASGANLILEISNSLNALFATAQVPDFMQMHVGAIDQAAIDRWTAADGRIAAQQTVLMITVDGTDLYLGESETPEENTVMDISFVKQNASFDYLLDLENQVAQLSPGEIGVPVYFAQERNLKLGDTVRLRQGPWQKVFTVAAIVRDAQMNPATFTPSVSWSATWISISSESSFLNRNS
jgi:putative ABC transport system permease protein